MTDIVKRAREALEGVTEGPWFHHDFSGAHDGEPVVQDACVSCTHPDHLTVCHMGGADFGWVGHECLDYANANARFIAAARQLVPEMVDEIERLRAELSSGSFYKESDIDNMQSENERLREALRHIDAVVYNDNGDVTYDTQTMAKAHRLARAALGK